MAYISVGLAFLQAVSAFPAIFPRDGLYCPLANGTVLEFGGKKWSIECGIDTYRGDMPAPNGQRYATFDQCISACAARAGCQSVAWLNKDACYLKGSIPHRRSKASVWGAVLASGTTGDAPSTSTSTVVQTATVTVVPEPVQQPSQPSVAAPVNNVVNAPKVQSSTSAPAASTATPVASNGGSTGGGSCGSRPAAKQLFTKRGVPYNSAALVAPFAGKISWAYNWGQTAGGSLPSGVEYISMLWGKKTLSGWAGNAQKALDAGATCLLGFNEPDHGDQAKMEVSEAVALWKQQMEPFACKARLGAPAVTNGGSPMGLTWLKSFMSACSDCNIDFVPVHWYDSATNVEYFKKHVQDAFAAGGNRPLWLTEFGATGSDAQISQFMATVIPWLDAQPYVERYSYFWAADNYLVSGSALSTIGKAYVGA